MVTTRKAAKRKTAAAGNPYARVRKPSTSRLGSTLVDLAQRVRSCKAIDLKDPALLELVENGKVASPFEIILRREVLKFTQAAFETALAFRSRKGAA